MNIEAIKFIISKGENLTVEFKESKTNLKQEAKLKRVSSTKSGYWEVLN